jgi:TonB family protein
LASMVDDKPQAERAITSEALIQNRQHRQMLVALGVLLAALVVVVIKDRDFWFSSPTEAAYEAATPAAPDQGARGESVQPQLKAVPESPQNTKSKSHLPAHPEREHISAAPAVAPEAASPAITATNRAALPPLEVEVVAGGQHTILQPSNRSVKVDMPSESPAKPAQGSLQDSTETSTIAAITREPVTAATNAGERVRLSPDTTQAVERPVQPNYPMLAKAMKVQGSVVLQALIGQEGSIQDLRVLSGPAILSTAAMDAVRQWRFRPYLQSGQPVETEARITVNFTISTN